MKKGFTTGSCAAAAAKAAAYMLLTGREKTQIQILTPAGITYAPAIEEIRMGEDFVSCAVKKESGDDPDITDGILIFAKVCFAQLRSKEREKEAAKEEAKEEAKESTGAKVIIQAGEGIGRVTRPGLDQPVGEAAINSVPRKMIETQVSQVMELFDQTEPLLVELSVPGGEKLAEKTFNPRLGIEGGISIIGTSGIVEPMSTKALLDTIRVELRQKKAMGARVAVISPGNYGLAFMKEQYDFDLDRAVKCSNFIGDTIDMARELGFQKLLLCGHIGKLIKVSGGIMNTHSAEGDCRMELIAASAIRCGGAPDILQRILTCVTTEEAIGILQTAGIDKACFLDITRRIEYYLSRRAKGEMEIKCILYANAFGLLGQSEGAQEFLRIAKE
ncbi:MAG: cobalt-precorrin-5B (C(1))-methyltransferase CbiD [Lachnospiraceae bacterium]|nr:cobalt-precorrin-5B (C(1))-methyltransferase CbiD [Lachnospiraceae bacterium]